jgi:tripartite-type tricarboxylate transporter receptor subunit TctC
MMKKLLTLALAAVAAFGAQAQSFPGSKPIALVVPFAAGGPTDRVARDLAVAMNKQIPGSNFVVENTLGAGGTLGANRVARAAPDGHTLLVWHVGMAWKTSSTWA